MARTDAASRVIAAPPDRVYAALVDPDALAAWLPPNGMTGRFERFDARPGGSYRMVLTYADASSAPGKASADSDIVEARFIDIVPGARVVQAVDFVSDEPAYAGTMTMTGRSRKSTVRWTCTSRHTPATSYRAKRGRPINHMSWELVGNASTMSKQAAAKTIRSRRPGHDRRAPEEPWSKALINITSTNNRGIRLASTTI